jgi:hypothetical protein
MRWILPDLAEHYIEQWVHAFAEGGIYEFLEGVQRTLLPSAPVLPAMQTNLHRLRRHGTLEVKAAGPVVYAASGDEGEPVVMYVGLAGLGPGKAKPIAATLNRALRENDLPTDLQPYKLLRDVSEVVPKPYLPLFEQLLRDDPQLLNVARYLDDLHHSPGLLQTFGSMFRPDHRPYRVFTLRWQKPNPNYRAVLDPGWAPGIVADVPSSAHMVELARKDGLGPLLPPRYWEVNVPREELCPD